MHASKGRPGRLHGAGRRRRLRLWNNPTFRLFPPSIHPYTPGCPSGAGLLT
jgi:hypothetical protein